MAKRGRKPAYETPEQMQAVIDEYFASCEERLLTDAKGEPVLDKKTGEPLLYGENPLTMSGLALALGFRSRQTLLDYREKAEFTDTIMRAKLRIEAYVESRLYDRDGVQGARFSLENNFGWSSKSETKTDADLRVIILDDVPDSK